MTVILWGVLLICSSVGGKFSATTHTTGGTAREQVKRRRRLLLIRGFVNGNFFCKSVIAISFLRGEGKQ